MWSIPHSSQCNVAVEKKTTDHLAVYLVELMGILLALQWVGDNNQHNAVITPSSISAHADSVCCEKYLINCNIC